MSKVGHFNTFLFSFHLLNNGNLQRNTVLEKCGGSTILPEKKILDPIKRKTGFFFKFSWVLSGKLCYL